MLNNPGCSDSVTLTSCCQGEEDCQEKLSAECHVDDWCLPLLLSPQLDWLTRSGQCGSVESQGWLVRWWSIRNNFSPFPGHISESSPLTQSVLLTPSTILLNLDLAGGNLRDKKNAKTSWIIVSIVFRSLNIVISPNTPISMKVLMLSLSYFNFLKTEMKTKSNAYLYRRDTTQCNVVPQY